MIRRPYSLLLIVAAQCAAPQRAGPAAGVDAQLHSDRLVVAFDSIPPHTSSWPVPSATSFPGYYDWRFGINGTGGFTASASVHAFEANAAGAHGSFGAIARSLRLRRCTPGGHVLTCADSLAGTIAVEHNRLLVTVRDPMLVAELQKQPLRYVWRAVFLADTILALDSIPLIHRP